MTLEPSAQPGSRMPGLQVGVCILATLLGAASPAALEAQTVLPARLGQPSWTAHHGFTSIAYVRELGDGTVILTDIDEPAVFVIDAASRDVRMLGRTGGGPGEYSSPTAIFPMPGDSTLILDRDARRYLKLDPNGRIVATTPFPPSLVSAAPMLRGADSRGRLVFQASAMSTSSGDSVALLRWDPASGEVEEIASVRVPNPRPIKLKSGATMRLIMPFTLQDDWSVAPSGRVVIVRATPFHFEWIGMDGTTERGPYIASTPVRVTDADRSAREPKGPPYRLDYPENKPPFEAGYTLVGADDVVIVERYVSQGDQASHWQAFDRKGRDAGSLGLPIDSRIVGLTKRCLYIARTDLDGLQWLDAYAR